MKLKVYSALKRATGKNVITLEVVNGSKVYDALRKLEARYGKKFKRETGREFMEAVRNFNIFLNGKNIQLPDGLSLKLEEEDEIIILQPVGGG